MEFNYFNSFWMIVLLLGIAKCITIAKRDTTSRICVYALMMALIGLLVSYTFQMVPISGKQGNMLPTILSFSCIMAYVSAVVLGGIGLAGYARHGTYRQGRKQAVSAIILSVVFLSITGAGFYQGLKHRRAATAFPEPRSAAAGPIAFDDLNYQYTPPGKPYVLIDAKALNKDASFALLRKFPQIYFFIIAEKIGFKGADHTEALVKIGQANMQSASTQCSFSGQQVYDVNGLKGIRYGADAQVRGLSLSYVFWMIQKNGYSYQLIASGKREDKKKIWQESAGLFSQFRQIEPDRIYYTDGSKPFGSYTSDLFGFSMDLGKSAWMRWEKAAEKYPGAEIGARLSDDAKALVVPVFYADTKPSLEALSTALLKSVEFDYPAKAIKDSRPIQVAGMPGYAIQYNLDDKDGKTYEVRCKIVSGAHHGYLAAAWLPGDLADKDKRFEEFFGPLHFSPRRLDAFKDTLLSERQKKDQARMINQIALYYYRNKVYDTALAYFKMATRFEPKKEVYLSNCLDAFNRLGKNSEALAFLDRHEGHDKEDPILLSWKAWHLKQTDQNDRAVTIYDHLFSGDYKNDEDFSIYAELLAEKKQWKKLDNAYGLYLKKNDTVQFQFEHADILEKYGNYDGAIRVLEAIREKIPIDAKIAFALIHNYNAVGQPRKSLEISQALIDKGLGSADAYYYKGDAEYQLKWYRKAKGSLEKALALAPQDSDIKDYIKQVSAMLGQGNNTSIKTPIKQVALPEILRKKLPALESEPQQKGFDSYYLNIINGYSYKSGKEYKHTTYKRIKVVDVGGVSRFSTLQMRFNSVSEEIYVNALIVRDEKGEIVSRGDPDDFYTIDSQKDEMATYDQTLCVPVPNLLPGYTIEITSTIRRSKSSGGFPFERPLIGASRPVLLGAVFYEGDPRALRYGQSNCPPPVKTPGGLAWILENPPIYRWEPRMVDYETFMAVVTLGSAKKTWEQLGQDYLDKIKDKLVLDAPVRALAASLVKKDRTDQAKIMTLAKYVQTHYSYKAIEFGSRGQIPNSAGLTIKNKYGDCKDHALLMHQLLKAVSIPSHLALVNTESDIASSLPSMDQFNHMILYLPAEPGGRFLDMTDKELDLRMLVPVGLAHRASLVLDPEHIRFVQIPSYDDNDKLNSQRDIEVMTSGDLNVVERIEFTGYAASFMRNALKSVERAKLQGWLQGILSDYESSARVKSFNLANLYENSQALVLDLNYMVKGRTKAGNRFSFHTPGIWEHYYLDVQPREDRRTSFKISYPFSFQSKVSVKAPDGFAFGDIAEGLNQGQGPFGQWRAQVDATGRKINLAFDCSLVPGVFGPEKYGDYHNMIIQALSSVNQDMSCDQITSD